MGPVVEPEFLHTDSLEEAVEASLSRSNYRPSDAAKAARIPKLATKKAPLITQQGEIIVLEGSSLTVSDLGDNNFGLVMTQQVRNPMEIVKEVLSQYEDDFDAVTVFTTFPDGGSQGSVAWYLGIRSSVTGVGAQPMDTGGWWGSGPGGKLHGFINMQYVGKYGDDLGNPNNWVHAVMAQEFGHRWGTFLWYVDENGQTSDAMLGRDDAHWASTLQANGSVMDGSEWVVTGDNKFWLKANNYRFSELDQYIMGLRGPEEVPDWFLIKNASYQGQQINPAWPLPNGVTITGNAETISIDQVIAAHGPRTPDHLTAPKEFRLAIVLVTRPDESQTSVSAFVQRLEAFRNTFEQVSNQMADGRMKICTQVSAPCDSAGVGIESMSVREHEGNGDSIIDPGEIVAIDFSVKSTGFGDAPEVLVELAEPNLEDLNIITGVVQLGDIPEGETVESAEPLLIKIPPTTGCGETAIIPLKLKTDGRVFPDEIQFDIGINTVVFDGLEKPDEWTMDPYGTDTVAAGGWEIADPKGVDALYIGVNLVTQPSQDYTADGVNALVTGPEAGQIGDHDVDGGTTTALSPNWDISDAQDPMLTWYSWHFAYDFNSPQGVIPVDNDVLYVEGSNDGGKTWVTLDADNSNTQSWVRKELRLADVMELTGTLQLRITMSDDPVSSLAEAAIDDIRIWDESLVCRPDLERDPPDDEQDTPDDDPDDEADDEETLQESDDEGHGAPQPMDPNGTATVLGGSGDDGSCSVGGSPNHGVVVLFALGLMGLGLIRRRKHG